MNKNLLKILSYVGIALIFLLVGILIGKNFNNGSVQQEELKLKTEKISVSTFIINSNNTNNSISTNDLTIDDNLLNTYEEVINSNNIKNKVKEKYSNVENIELEKIENTGMVKAIYVCDRDSETECIEINNKYVSLFADSIDDIYNVSISIVDKATISTRTIKEE